MVVLVVLQTGGIYLSGATGRDLQRTGRVFDHGAGPTRPPGRRHAGRPEENRRGHPTRPRAISSPGTVGRGTLDRFRRSMSPLVSVCVKHCGIDRD